MMVMDDLVYDEIVAWEFWETYFAFEGHCSLYVPADQAEVPADQHQVPADECPQDSKTGGFLYPLM